MSSPISIIPQNIPDVLLVSTRWFEDERGAFTEVYNGRVFRQAGIEYSFEQENLAVNTRPNTIRALHYQRGEAVQAKLVRVLRGSIFDVAVDLRQGSPWYGAWVGVELSAANRAQLLVPPGFAHGYCTLEPDTEVSYLVDAPYAPDHEGGVRWNDPDLAIDWPVSGDQAILAIRDRQLPLLGDCPHGFIYTGA